MSETPDPSWIESRLIGARPKVIAAFLRYFRDLDMAEEAYQDACLKALKAWPESGPPRDPVAWLIMAGRNAKLDQVRRDRRMTQMPPDDPVFDGESQDGDIAERIDHAAYRDDILRLLFVCCHPDLPATQQVALALRIVSGLPVARIASAFLVKEKAMEQRITRAKARIAEAHIPFETPNPAERQQRFDAVMTMIYLVFNEGYTDANPASDRAALCDEAIRLARLLLRMFPTEPEMIGLLALMLIQHSRQQARFKTDGEVILLEDQDRSLWDHERIREALSLIDRALMFHRPGRYQLQAAIAAIHARAKRPEDTDWSGIERLYRALEAHHPSPVVALNRAVAVMKLHGPDAALALIEPLSEPLDGYFYFHGLRGTLLRDLNRKPEARAAFTRAIALANTAAEAAHIRNQLDQI